MRSAFVITRAVSIIICSAIVITSCSVTTPQISARAVCPPIKNYTPEQDKQVAMELRTRLPGGSETERWLGDYLTLRDILRACAK